MNKWILLLSLWVGVIFTAKAESTASAPLTQDQKTTKEIMELEKQVSALAAKINVKEASVNQLIAQKQTETDSAKVAEIIKLLQQEHRELQGLIKDHAAQLGVLKYRYPERGVAVQRKYKRFDSKSLEEMEKTIGLEGHLRQAREKVKKVYGEETSSARKPATAESEKKTSESQILSPTVISK